MGGKPRKGKRHPNKNGPRFISQYVHYLTGELMVASDYGYKAWPFGPKN